MVVFGGRSGEHEVSLASARAITQALGKSGRYEVVPVGITREGRWISSGEPMKELESRSGYPPDGSGAKFPGSTASDPPVPAGEKLPVGLGSVDVVFPVLHGPMGEDGTIQGMLELAGIPYVGSGVLGSAVAMDKAMAKLVLAQAGIPQGRWELVTQTEWEDDADQVTSRLLTKLGLPLFVKP